MKRLIIMSVALTFLLCLSFPAQADRIDRRADEATNIVVGKIKQVKSFYATNKWGDDLIMSEVTLKVDKVHKGDQVDEVTFIVEGGAVGDIVLRVSSVPLFEEGEELILFLKKKNGRFEYIGSHKFGVSGAKAKPSPPSKPPALECCKTFAKWENPDVKYYINPNGGDMEDECVIGDIQAAADTWNYVSGINLDYSGSPASFNDDNIDANINLDETNIIFFRNDSSGGTIAVTYTWYTRKGRKIVEFDMVFYDWWAFFALLQNCNNGCDEGFYLQTIAAHEFGHAIGLDHNRCTDSLMYPYVKACEDELLEPYDTACVQSLYGE